MIKTLYESQKKVIKLFDYCSRIISEAKNKASYGKGLKILTPKQMPQRLPIALAHKSKQVIHLKILFDEIIQIIYSLYLAKEITKKVYINIIIQ